MRIRPLAAVVFAALALGAAPAAAATPPRTLAPAARIIDGHAPTQAWPAQVSVVFRTATGTFDCGGTLVSARWILTAGHCATDDAGVALAPANYNVTGGLQIGGTTRFNGRPFSVDQVLRHPDYTTASGAPVDDLALLHVAGGPLPQEPVRLVGAAETALWSPGVQAKVIGWGTTRAGTPSPTLLEAEVPLVGDGDCRAVARLNPGFDPASMVCAGGGSTDTCTGDSGGPLLVAQNGAYTIAGVTSWGVDVCASPGVPGVYARLGAPALNAWVRGKVPTVAIALSPATPSPGDLVALAANVDRGAEASAPAAVSWDLDDDGAFDDATGNSASVTAAAPGTQFVRVQALFADGDRAVTRDPVIPAPAPAPPPPPPPPPPPAPAPAPAPPAATGPTPEELQQILRAVPIGTVTARGAVRLATLRAGTSLRVTFDCRLACAISGRLTVSAATARRYRLSSQTIGSGRGSLRAAGRDTMTVRLGARAKRALRRATRFTATLATALTGDGAAAVQGTQRITVSR